ncbi:hypothetical protein ACPBEI_01155 [Latilactobacillus sakei]
MLNKKINDNKSTLVALQTQYAKVDAALKVTNDKVKEETKATKAVEISKAKTTPDKSEFGSASNDNKTSSTSKIEDSSISNSKSVQFNNDMSTGDGSTHDRITGN